MKILMAAAENDALPGGKVGGIADVVRDIPIALASIGHNVSMVTPGYGHFSTLPGTQFITSLEVTFNNEPHTVDVYKLSLENSTNNVTQWIIEHPLFAIGGVGKIYCDDPSHKPFATDATKFALFSIAVAEAIINNVFDSIDILHLHDWHTAMVSVLRAYDERYRQLQSIKTVYTIHNLALQGIRPIEGDESSLKSWFPELTYDLSKINDPRYPDCYNPMRSAINLADKVHAVSPTYAKEILLPSNIEQGYFGGEGLEKDLQNANNTSRLFGILNGCEYDQEKTTPLNLTALLTLLDNQLLSWIENKPLVESAHLIAIARIKQLMSKSFDEEPIILTSVGRITEQKVRLFQQILPDGNTALSQLLNILSDKGVFILLGSGDKTLEQFLENVAANHTNFIFIKGYSEALPEKIYSSGDLFLMPSSFEPCGISQMLSMRAGQPCLVHCVGGLNDTINNNENGFSFSGGTIQQQAENMLTSFSSAIHTMKNDTKRWDNICSNALKSRFMWESVALDYGELLYKN